MIHEEQNQRPNPDRGHPFAETHLKRPMTRPLRRARGFSVANSASSAERLVRRAVPDVSDGVAPLLGDWEDFDELATALASHGDDWEAVGIHGKMFEARVVDTVLEQSMCKV